MEEAMSRRQSFVLSCLVASLALLLPQLPASAQCSHSKSGGGSPGNGRGPGSPNTQQQFSSQPGMQQRFGQPPMQQMLVNLQLTQLQQQQQQQMQIGRA